MNPNPQTSRKANTQERDDVFQKAASYTRARETRATGLYPYFIPIEGSEGTEVTIAGKPVVMLGSNNYLGLTHDPRVLEAGEAASRSYGAGCTGSRFLNGTLDLHLKLEAELADFVGKEETLVFSTGYQTNLGCIAALVGRDDTALIDKLDHACIVDGATMAPGQLARFRHNDMRDLAEQLERIPTNRGVLIAVDGVFSMDGDLTPLPEVLELAHTHGARVLVDEAHSLGVVGPKGAGVTDHFGLAGETDLIMGTFSKSFASIGGFMAGDSSVIDYLRHNARPMIFSAAMPPYAVATVLKSLEIIRTEPERRVRLWEIQNLMKNELAGMGWDVGSTETPIIPIVIGESHMAFQLWRALLDGGVFTNPVVSPAVPEGKALLRTSYIATHTDDQLHRALEIFRRVGKELGLI
jgi:8-amino-7-oxononanoate synthase